MAFPTDSGEVRAVDGISYDLSPGASLGMVGESGCGKTMAALALLRLVPPPGRITGGSVRFQGGDLLAASKQRMEAVRGNHMAMIFQEPMTALNPVFTVGDQIAEVLTTHGKAGPREAWAEAIDLLDRVGIPAPSERVHDYTHSLSGGMAQRVMIAMALACKPALLIADEPTTALDVTVQAQFHRRPSQFRWSRKSPTTSSSCMPGASSSGRRPANCSANRAIPTQGPYSRLFPRWRAANGVCP